MHETWRVCTVWQSRQFAIANSKILIRILYNFIRAVTVDVLINALMR